jgi:nucleolar GTP-binding protein
MSLLFLGMNFQSLPPIEFPDEMLDKAFSRARKRADYMQSTRSKESDKFLLQKKVAYEKVATIKLNVAKDLSRITTAFPDFSNLPEFYEELVKSRFAIDEVKLALGRVGGLLSQLDTLVAKTQITIRQAETVAQLQAAVESFYGRLSGSMQKTKSAFTVLEKVRSVLVSFPTIKDGCFSVALAGFPNVGKSTLLSQLTTSKPKIAPYAFTTTTLNVGYYKQAYDEVQVIDTPGTLARFEKMNAVEQQAFLCLKYVADVIVMIIDPTETYPLQDQEKLLAEVRVHEKPIIVYLSKTDIADELLVAKLQKKFSAIVDKDELREQVKQLIKKW